MKTQLPPKLHIKLGGSPWAGIKRLPSQLFPKVQVKRPSFLQIPILSQAAGENGAATQAPHQVGWVSMGWETLRIKRLPSQLFPKVQVKRLSFLQTPIVSQAAGENAAATHFSHYLQRSACMQGLYHTRLGTYLCSFECNASGGKS